MCLESWWGCISGRSELDAVRVEHEDGCGQKCGKDGVVCLNVGAGRSDRVQVFGVRYPALTRLVLLGHWSPSIEIDYSRPWWMIPVIVRLSFGFESVPFPVRISQVRRKKIGPPRALPKEQDAVSLDLEWRSGRDDRRWM
jgi:hypothetical protein